MPGETESVCCADSSIFSLWSVWGRSTMKTRDCHFLLPALGIIKAFCRHTHHRTGFTVRMTVHRWKEWCVTHTSLHWCSQNFAPHLLLLHLWYECRQHMQRITPDFISSFINSLACARHQQVQESQHSSAPVETQRTRKGKDSSP